MPADGSLPRVIQIPKVRRACIRWGISAIDRSMLSSPASGYAANASTVHFERLGGEPPSGGPGASQFSGDVVQSQDFDVIATHAVDGDVVLVQN